jgi:hypothetical protein
MKSENQSHKAVLEQWENLRSQQQERQKRLTAFFDNGRSGQLPGACLGALAIAPPFLFASGLHRFITPLQNLSTSYAFNTLMGAWSCLLIISVITSFCAAAFSGVKLYRSFARAYIITVACALATSFALRFVF